METSTKITKQEEYKHHSVRIISILSILLLLVACGKHSNEEEMSRESRSLQVTTRTENIELTYPLRIYAFDTEGKPAGITVINNADENCSLTLPEGSYHLVALAGTDGCNLPENPEKTSNITLLENNYSTSPQMMGSVDVTLSNADAEVNITLTYRVARIELSLSDIPEAVTAVKVSFSPLYNALNFEGNYTGESNKTTIACTKQDALWKAPLFYTFPGSGQSLTLSIEMTDAKETKTYGYTYEEKLEAGFPYSLIGSYKQGFSVNGTLTAEGWGETKNIGFTFGGGNTGESEESETETPDPGNDDTYTVTEIPAAGTLWNGHAVVAVQNATATGADLLLLSLKEWKNVPSAASTEKPTEAATLTAAYNEKGISGWRIPTKDETVQIKAKCGGIIFINTFNDLLTQAGGDPLSGSGNDSQGYPVRYLCDNAINSYDLKNTSGNNSQASNTRTYNLRTVKTVHVTRQTT